LNSTEIEGDELLNFKFILYASFESEAESIGLELCESLHAYCAARGIPTFQLITRFSVGGALRQRRWDAEFIKA